MKHYTVVLAVALAAFGSGVPPAAVADTVESRTCVNTASRFRFYPPLAATDGYGLGYLDNVYTCPGAVVQTSPAGVSPFQVGGTNTVLFGWSGNCALTRMTGSGWSMNLVGGVLMVQTSNSANRKGAGSYVVVPNAPCTVSVANGPGMATMVIT